ncbi:MAG: glucosaminidase domain-containing protein [Erysipelotrichaceae bacterium]
MTKRKRNKNNILSPLQIMILSGVGIMMLMCFVAFKSTPITYEVVNYDKDNNKTTLHYYQNFTQAKQSYDQLIKENKFNPAILKGNELLAIRYGVLSFKRDTCGINTSFTYENNDLTGYTNGCYGGDGAYIETNEDASLFKFKLSGTTGWVKTSDVKLYNYFDQNQVKSVNHYIVKDGFLIHKGTADLHNESYNLSINIGEANSSYVAPIYYSYDAHYFYERYPEMIDDYRNNTYVHSVNSEQPHINYYQYLTHRSLSNYTKDDINWYIENYLGFNGKLKKVNDVTYHSQLFHQGKNFINNQNKYGVNAIMMFSLACNESDFGRSSIAYENNNLFGHAAYDASPGASANKYKSVGDSIEIHARLFLSLGYLNPCDGSKDGTDLNICMSNPDNRYFGGYFGDKNSGLNVRYASDPYWGEKAAAYYRTFDEVLGNKDHNSEHILMLRNESIPIYAQADRKRTLLYRTTKNTPSFVLTKRIVKGETIDGNDEWYEIQSDANIENEHLLSDKGLYVKKNSVGYLHSSYLGGKR